jgi:hypothetical protein
VNAIGGQRPVFATRRRVVLPLLVFLTLLPGCSGGQDPVADAPVVTAGAGDSPLNATYTLDGTPFALHAGRFERPAAPGSAAMESLTVLGTPVEGDLDGDGDDDAALILIYRGGGSGTFYYLAAALATNGAYQGTNALLLGDRIEPGALVIQHGHITVQWLDRAPAAPLAVAPTVAVKRYAYLEDQQLVFVADDVTWAGMLTLGHEVRAFRPCGSARDFWLLGTSPALPALLATHRDLLAQAPAYTPLHVVLTGREVPPPDEGFGADYPAAFLAERLLQTSLTDRCAGDDAAP